MMTFCTWPLGCEQYGSGQVTADTLGNAGPADRKCIRCGRDARTPRNPRSGAHTVTEPLPICSRTIGCIDCLPAPHFRVEFDRPKNFSSPMRVLSAAPQAQTSCAHFAL